MTKLELLRIYDSPFTGAGLQQLGGLRRLRELSIARSMIVDAELRHLKLFENLVSLGVSDCSQITDAGLTHLYPMIQLQLLSFSSSRITDAGLKPLAGMTNLEILILGIDQMTNAGLEHIRGLQSLEQLVLSGRGMTDDGLAHLADLERLQKLVLFRVSVDGPGLSHLKRLTALRELHFNQTKVTNFEIESLKAALPECQIRRISPPPGRWR